MVRLSKCSFIFLLHNVNFTLRRHAASVQVVVGLSLVRSFEWIIDAVKRIDAVMYIVPVLAAQDSLEFFPLFGRIEPQTTTEPDPLACCPEKRLGLSAGRKHSAK